ncbi:unnamed protein product [Victoria cruziana]
MRGKIVLYCYKEELCCCVVLLPRQVLLYEGLKFVLREVDDNEEWPSNDENVHENDDFLTCDHVDIACGVSQETGGASTRATQKKGKQKVHDSSTRNRKRKHVAFDVDEEEEMSSGDSDDEEEDSLHL